MVKYEFQKAVRVELLDELIKEGFSPLTRVSFTDNKCWVECEPEQFDKVAQAVAAHNPAAYLAQALEAKEQLKLASTTIASGVAQLASERALLEGASPLTAADVRRILLLQVRFMQAAATLME